MGTLTMKIRAIHGYYTLDEARDWHPWSDRVLFYLLLKTEYGLRLVLRGSRSTYDIMHNGGYLALPTYIGE